MYGVPWQSKTKNTLNLHLEALAVMHGGDSPRLGMSKKRVVRDSEGGVRAG